MTEAFMTRLMEAKTEFENVLGGVAGALLAIMVEFGGVVRDEHVRLRDEHKKLKDRIKDLEGQIHVASGPNSDTPNNTPVPPGPGTSHDYQQLPTDLGSNAAVTGTFAINSTVFSGNAANTTGTGVGSTLQFYNISQSDRQLVGGHKIVLRAAGTPGTPAVNAPIKLWSANFPVAFDRTPAVRPVALDANAASLTVFVDASPTGYTIYAVGGTLTAGQGYGFQLTVQPS